MAKPDLCSPGAYQLTPLSELESVPTDNGIQLYYNNGKGQTFLITVNGANDDIVAYIDTVKVCFEAVEGAPPDPQSVLPPDPVEDQGVDSEGSTPDGFTAPPDLWIDLEWLPPAELKEDPEKFSVFFAIDPCPGQNVTYWTSVQRAWYVWAYAWVSAGRVQTSLWRWDNAWSSIMKYTTGSGYYSPILWDPAYGQCRWYSVGARGLDAYNCYAMFGAWTQSNPYRCQ
jgi:hypothetical protein